MTKYTDEQLAKAAKVFADSSTCISALFIDYLRTEAKADIEAGFWDEPIDPIEQARRDAREICVEFSRQGGYNKAAEYCRNGDWDETWAMRCVFRAICQERGLEVPS